MIRETHCEVNKQETKKKCLPIVFWTWQEWEIFRRLLWLRAQASSGENGLQPHWKAFLSTSLCLFTHPAALAPPFLGGLEFASRSPRWHWRLCLAQPAITLLPWTIAVGFQEPFHLISFKNNASSGLCPQGWRAGESRGHLMLPLLSSKTEGKWLWESAALPWRPGEGLCFYNMFRCFYSW